jgi:farnesyl-diphosphate farnesyltransferase
VNILRDLPSDLRLGRCYLPSERLHPLKLAPADLLAFKTEPRFRHVYDEYLGVARGHLLAGWAYTIALPKRQVRVRLACAWPLLIGFDTLELLSRVNSLDPEVARKVTRAQVKKAIWRSLLLYPFPPAWNGLVRS